MGAAGTDATVGNEEAVLAAAVREAGAAIREKFVHGAQVFTKADNSPVTEADLAANAILVARLGAAYPADAILSEEDVPAPDIADAPRCWIIDPLDGTASFVRREPTFAVMVALEIGGRPQVGAVYNPMSDELFTATAGAGARLTVGEMTTPLRFTPVPVADGAHRHDARFLQNPHRGYATLDRRPGPLVPQQAGLRFPPEGAHRRALRRLSRLAGGRRTERGLRLGSLRHRPHRSRGGRSAHRCVRSAASLRTHPRAVVRRHHRLA